MTGVRPSAVGAVFGFAAFATAILLGLLAENPADRILGRALVSMALCYTGGWVIGLMIHKIVLDHARAQDAGAPPVPELADERSPGESGEPVESPEELSTS